MSQALSVVKVGVDASGAIRPLNRISRAAKGTEGAMGRLRKAALGVFTAVGLFQTARFIVVKTAELETQRRSLEVLTGSLEKTGQIIREIQEFGALTPFTSSELITTAKQLKAFGVETDKIVATTKRLGDIAGATGSDLNGIARAYGKIQSKGKLTMEENIQLLERGVDITTVLKEITGLQGDEFAAAMRKGQISSQMVEVALRKLTDANGQYFEGAISQSDTLNGKWSTAIDNIETMARFIGETLSPAIKKMLDMLNDVLGVWNETFRLMGDAAIGQSFKKIQLANISLSSGLKSDAIDQMLESVQALDTTFVQSEGDAKKLEQQLNRISNISFKLNRLGANNLTDTQLDQMILLSNTIDNLRDKINEIRDNGFGKINEQVNDLDTSINEVNTGVTNLTETSDELQKMFDGIIVTVRDGLVDAIMGAVEGTKTLGEVASSVFRNISRALIQYGISAGLSGMFPWMAPALGFGKKAAGGPVGKDKPYLVGERGPEMFVPNSSGRIVPNNQMGGGSTSIVVNVDASGSSAEGDDGQAAALGNMLGQAIQAELVRQKRPGGLLAA